MKRNYDLTGQVFGKLTVVRFTGLVDNHRGRMWECKCECGNTTYTSTSLLIQGKKKSCGCLRKEPHKAMEDCISYNKERKRGCDALTEMLCVKKGNCKFYKPKEESNDEDKT